MNAATGNTLTFRNNKVYTGYSKIWSFFDDFFLLENKEIENIIKEWLNEKYKLRVATIVLVPEFSII